MILKTPFGYIDLLHTWEGWTLIGAVLMALAVLAWWMERGKVTPSVKYFECYYCRHTVTKIQIERARFDFSCPRCGRAKLSEYSPVCHGTGRVRRRWISRMLHLKSRNVT